MDEFLKRDPAVSTDPTQPRHLYAVPALCLSEGRLPRKQCALLAGGAEIQGKRSKNTWRVMCWWVTWCGCNAFGSEIAIPLPLFPVSLRFKVTIGYLTCNVSETV